MQAAIAVTAEPQSGPHAGLTRLEFVFVLAAVFTVALGYGVALPILPAIVERFVGASNVSVGWYTGAASGLFTTMLGLWAPLSGWFSDRYGRRPVALVGLGGFVPAMVLLGMADSLRGLYLALAVAGACASAVLPVAAALVGDRSEGDRRARHIAWVGTATLLGFMAGPMLGGWLGGAPARGQPLPVLTPFLVVALMAAAVWLSWQTGLRNAPARGTADAGASAGRPPRLLLGLTVVLMYGVASFEVGLTLHARQSLGLDAADLSLLFMECSAVMIVFQALLFPIVRKRVAPNVALAVAFLSIAGAFALLPGVQDFRTLSVLVALVSGGAGLLSPMLSYQLATGTPNARGFTLGLQTAVSSAGQALGSFSAGMLFGLMAVSPFWITAAAFALGGAAGAGLRVINKIDKE